MPNQPVNSLADLGESAGRSSERHLIAAFDAFVRGGASTTDGAGFLGVVTGEPHPFANFVLVEDPDDAATLSAALAVLPEGGLPVAVVVPCPQVGAAAAERLAAAGFAHVETMPAMAVDTSALAATELPPGYGFARVGPASAELWSEALAEGYEIPIGCARAFTPRELDPGLPPDAPVQIFAVTRGDRMVATSLLALADGVAGIYCVSTLAEERGKGLGAHATAEPLRRARELGYGVGALQSSASGHSVYLRLGFSDLGGCLVFVRMPDSPAS